MIAPFALTFAIDVKMAALMNDASAAGAGPSREQPVGQQGLTYAGTQFVADATEALLACRRVLKARLRIIIISPAWRDYKQPPPLAIVIMTMNVNPLPPSLLVPSSRSGRTCCRTPSPTLPEEA